MSSFRFTIVIVIVIIIIFCVSHDISQLAWNKKWKKNAFDDDKIFPNTFTCLFEGERVKKKQGKNKFLLKINRVSWISWSVIGVKCSQNVKK